MLAIREINVATTFCVSAIFFKKHAWASDFDVIVFIFTRFRRPHLIRYLPAKIFSQSGRRFKIYPSLCGRFTRLRVDGKRNRENIYAVSNLHG